MIFFWRFVKFLNKMDDVFIGLIKKVSKMYIWWFFLEYALRLLSMPIGYFFPRTPRLVIVIIFVCFSIILKASGISHKIDNFFNLSSTINNGEITSLNDFLGASFYLLIMEYGGIWLIYFFATMVGAMESVKMLESSHLEEKNKCLSVWLFFPILTFLGIFLFSWMPSSWIPFYYLIKGDFLLPSSLIYLKYIGIIFGTELVNF
eukprot:GHVP01044203.1.p1 GENE.GHVP01044203.1~~GHVP01044203.1.p1  ORF type:complete len:204 (-),score=20.26 GHVP01044203.1:70-681(-)